MEFLSMLHASWRYVTGIAQVRRASASRTRTRQRCSLRTRAHAYMGAFSVGCSCLLGWSRLRMGAQGMLAGSAALATLHYPVLQSTGLRMDMIVFSERRWLRQMSSICEPIDLDEVRLRLPLHGKQATALCPFPSRRADIFPS
jgi:hypothetical protein